jgi:hypothetical protein
MILVQPTYFSPIIQYVGIANSSAIMFETEDNFQKQTYRNRCYIYTSYGKHALIVPIQHNKSEKQKTKDIKIDYKDSWQKLHLRTLITAYNSSPFFEFYMDDLAPIFEKQTTFLLDLNIKCHNFLMDAMQLEIPTKKTTEYHTKPNCLDLRKLAIAKGEKNFKLTQYYQVFNENFGFISNLSMLDLLFMEGPNALNYLESQNIQF